MDNNTEIFDVLVAGGGISGIGAAIATAKRGLKTVVIEKNKICSATSNNSLRIIHGGLRYLQSFDFIRSKQSLKDQAYLLQQAADCVRPLICLMPLEKTGLRSKFPVACGLTAYQLMVSLWGAKSIVSKIIDPKTAMGLVPTLANSAPYGALLWTDGIISDPKGLTAQVRGEAEKLGVKFIEDVNLEKIDRNKVGRFRSSANGNSWASKVVVDARGPWIANRERFKWCKAFNLVVNKLFSSEAAFAVRSAEGRLYFVVPRGEQSVIGTQYLPCKGNDSDGMVSDVEIASFISGFNSALGMDALRNSDVTAIDIGTLPMKDYKHGQVELYGSEEIQNDRGFVTVLSTKYTTFMSQGEKVAKQINGYF